MNEKFLKPYNPADTEDRIYKMWLDSGYFNPDKLPANEKMIDQKIGKEVARFSEPFSIVLPPPNVTGTLHMGSAFMLALEDIMVRYARMQGKKALWIPGTDHAAIATQAKVEKEIQKKEGKSRHDLGRAELIKRVEAFAQESHDTIIEQIRKMGCSIDWSREAFTLDEKRNFAVRTAFKKMYDDGLIYRGFRVVNWDPKGQTTISDDEIVYEPRKGKLYTFKYGKDTRTGEMIPISISTTRPETKLGDMAIAVHPDDARYAKYVGKEYETVFAGEPIHIKVIADSTVEPEFGTGALGVTPAHSVVDWEMAQRHQLVTEIRPLKQVINEYAKMTVGFDGTEKGAGEFPIKNKKTTEAREAVVAWLRAENLLEKEEDIDQNVSVAERTGGVIEPLPKLQWFVAVNKKFARETNGGVIREVTLKELMKEAITTDGVKIIPDRFERVYFNWIDNLRDWCISRQIWYGHRIPVWYKKDSLGDDNELYCDIIAPQNKPGEVEWRQDEDTLDTWFSSGLWTFSTLGWPQETADMATYHPTTVLETGSDILFFWVARMILMSKYLLGDVPFKTVYIHGLVRDGKGQKISKSLGNNTDPLDMIAKYGADAVRMALVVGVGPGNDSKVDENKIKAYKNFANKLWNIARFVLSSAEGDMGPNMPAAKPVAFDADFKDYSSADLVLRDEFNSIIKDVTTDMDNYRLYLAAEKLYAYAWRRFADEILEDSKKVFKEVGKKESAKESTADAFSRKQLLLHTLMDILRALHPFMPYVTEEIWTLLDSKREINSNKKSEKLLIIEKWPN
jgi:valyl-tRNA synthetase